MVMMMTMTVTSHRTMIIAFFGTAAFQVKRNLTVPGKPENRMKLHNIVNLLHSGIQYHFRVKT